MTAPPRPGLPAAAALGLAELFPPGREAGIDDCGATAVLGAVCRTPLTAAVTATRTRLPTADEQDVLQVGPRDPLCDRSGNLCADGWPVAEITASFLPARLGTGVLEDLGYLPDGTPAPGGPTAVPLGRALRGHGARRIQVMTALTPGQRSASGKPQVLYSSAILYVPAPGGGPRRPAAIVTERIYEAVLDAFPPPWTAP